MAVAIALLARGGGVAGQRLVLVGIGVAAALQSTVTFLLTRTDVRTAQEALVWLSGSLNQATWERAGTLALGLAVLVPALAAAARALGGLQLGDDAAAAARRPAPRGRRDRRPGRPVPALAARHRREALVTRVVEDPVTGGPLVVPVGRHHTRQAVATGS